MTRAGQRVALRLQRPRPYKQRMTRPKENPQGSSARYNPGPMLTPEARQWLKERYTATELCKLGAASMGSIMRALSGFPIKLISRDKLQALYDNRDKHE